jgi:flagellar protein FliL
MSEQPSGTKQLILGLVIVSVLGGLAGVGGAYLLSGSMTPQPQSAANESAEHGNADTSEITDFDSEREKEATGEGEPATDDHGNNAVSGVVVLPPVITNLASPRDVWMRLEAAVLLKEGNLNSEETSHIATDVMSFLRTLSIDQIEGPSAFQHLREDLLERVNIRLEGRASEFLIFGMVVE